MSLIAQAKVLRALQENKVSPVGSDKEIKVDVRVLAATNKDMKKEIAEGRFREDLYHRLSVIEIHVPALDDRKEDIPLLVSHFVKNIAEEQKNNDKEFDKAAIEALKNYSWTGNIRELRNVVERLIILGGNPVTAEDVESFVRK
jgi:DNA-binding NtrC family response regulator